MRIVHGSHALCDFCVGRMTFSRLLYWKTVDGNWLLHARNKRTQVGQSGVSNVEAILGDHFSRYKLYFVGHVGDRGSTYFRRVWVV